MEIYTSTEVAVLLGIPFYRLYYLELTGKINSPKRTGTGRRYYTTEDVQAIKEKLNSLNNKKGIINE